MHLIYALQDADNPNSLSSRFRRARARRVVELIRQVFAQHGQVRVLDRRADAQVRQALLEA